MATIHINLLDWRAARRERRKQQFGVAAGMTAALAAGVVAIGLLAVNTALGNQNERNEFLKGQIAEMDRQIKEIQELEKTKADLIARMEVIQQLQKDRSDIVHFFDEMVSILPDGVYVTSVKQQGNKITIDGVAESNGRISTYLKNLDASEWFSDPRLVVIKAQQDQFRRLSNFTLSVTAFAEKHGPATGAEEGEVLE
ncbi:MAG: PilN domain-containing protein [Nevskiales bacterium]